MCAMPACVINGQFLFPCGSDAAEPRICERTLSFFSIPSPCVPSSLGIKSLEFNWLLGAQQDPVNLMIFKPRCLMKRCPRPSSGRNENLSGASWRPHCSPIHSFHLSHLLLSARPPTSKKAICNVTPNFISHVAAAAP